MTGKTHLVWGMAAAVAVSRVDSPAQLTTALAIGALGGVFADADALKNDKGRDALKGQLLSLAVLTLAMAAGAALNWGFWFYVQEHRRAVGFGAAGLALLWVFSVFQPHRGFSHSLLALGLFTGCGYLLYPSLTGAFFAGYASHLILDLMNKKGLRLFWPLKKTVCLGLFYADRTADRLLLGLGFLLAACLTVLRALAL